MIELIFILFGVFIGLLTGIVIVLTHSREPVALPAPSPMWTTKSTTKIVKNARKRKAKRK